MLQWNSDPRDGEWSTGLLELICGILGLCIYSHCRKASLEHPQILEIPDIKIGILGLRSRKKKSRSRISGFTWLVEPNAMSAAATPEAGVGEHPGLPQVCPDAVWVEDLARPEVAISNLLEVDQASRRAHRVSADHPFVQPQVRGRQRL